MILIQAQAVSKWENGAALPDTGMIKGINDTMNMDLLTCLKDPMTREVRLLRKPKVVEQDNDNYRDVFIPNGIQFRFVLNDARYLQRIPGLFRGIIQKAKQILQVLIRETEILPKPTLSVDMAEYREMQKLMVKVQDEARTIKQLFRFYASTIDIGISVFYNQFTSDYYTVFKRM